LYEISFDDATRNILVLGGTGRGKTQSVLRPASYRLIEAGCAGLILDAKNDYALLSEEFPEQVLRLSLDNDTAINIIAGIDLPTFRALLDNIRRTFSTAESYWGMSGVEDAILVFLYHKAAGQDPTLSDIYAGIVNPRVFCHQLERYLLTQPSLPKDLHDQIQYRLSDIFSILWVGEFHENETNTRAEEQYTWQTNILKRVLSPFANNPAIEQTFCSHSEIDYNEILYNKEQTIIIDINPDQLPDVSKMMGQVVRLMFMRAVTSVTPLERQRQGYGVNKFTFMLIDEYQQFINTSYADSGNTLRDDNAWIDRSRAYGHINILATQSISSLYTRSGQSAVNTIVQNCQTLICLPTTDTHTINRIAELSYDASLINPHTQALLHPKEIGVGYIHIANHQASKHGSLSGMFRSGKLSNPKYHYMSRYIQSRNRRASSTFNHNSAPRNAVNPFFKPLPEMEYLTGTVVVISTCMSTCSDNLIGQLSNMHGISNVELIHLESDSPVLSDNDTELLCSLIKGDVVIFTSFPVRYRPREYTSRLNLFRMIDTAKDEGVLIVTLCDRDNTAIDYLRDAHRNYDTEQHLLCDFHELFHAI
jgi:hypothetical protein